MLTYRAGCGRAVSHPLPAPKTRPRTFEIHFSFAPVLGRRCMATSNLVLDPGPGSTLEHEWSPTLVNSDVATVERSGSYLYAHCVRRLSVSVSRLCLTFDNDRE